MHDICDKQHDNLKYGSVHDLNCDCKPACIGSEEISFNNYRNNFDINCSISHASSYIPPMTYEPCSGTSFLTDLLLQNHLSGITASPFLANLDTLQKSVSLHGIVVYALSHEEYKSILL